MPGEPDQAGSGIPELDEVLGGGFPRDHIFLVKGDAGAGKTTLGLQFLLEGARKGEKVLHIATGESLADVRQVAEAHGWSLDRISFYQHGELKADEPYLTQTMLHPAEVELPATLESLYSKIEEVRPQRLVIDSLAEIRLLARHDDIYRRQLLALKAHLAEKHCTVLLIDVPTGEDQTVETVVNGVMELEQLSSLYGPDRRRLRISKIRGRDFQTGFHDYRIQTGGIDVYPRLIAAQHFRSFTPEIVSSGVPELDRLLGGGLDRGTSTLLLGQTGSGKSLVATRFVVAAAERGEPCAMYVFDERVQTLFQRSAGVGIPLERYVEEGLVEVRQIDPAEMSAGEFSSLLRRAVEEGEARLIVIDSLNGYAYAMPEERFLGLHLHELTSYLNQQGVTSLFVAAANRLSSDGSGSRFDVSYIADTVLLFGHFEHEGEIHKAVAVHKRRGGAHEPNIRELFVSSEGLSLGPPLKGLRGILTGTPDVYGGDLDDRARQDSADPD